MVTAWQKHIIRNDKDPYQACLIGLTEHQHYKDCANCGRKDLCDIHEADELLRLTHEAVEDAKRFLKSRESKKKPLP